METLTPGSQVDQFRIIRKLGRGGMSEVYLARDTTLGRKVALKIIHVDGGDSPRKLKQFLNEAYLTAKFAHPNIITIHSVGVYEGHPYLALEYLEGQTLDERKREGAISATEAMRIGLTIAQALEEAHSHGVFHRDLKPANVIIPLDGRIRVLDFGISKIIGNTRVSQNFSEDFVSKIRGLHSAFHSAANVIPERTTSEQRDQASGDTLKETAPEMNGTPAYMSPERWFGEKASGAGDVWSLGVILYEMLAQVHPFLKSKGGLAAVATSIMLAEEPPAFPLDLNIPPELSHLITSMLHKEPSQRPPAKLIVEVLQGLLQRKRGQPLESTNPFRGLLPFSERHADLFFGRSAEIEVALERLRYEPILPVVGPSGAGKSSFVAAGIVPRLREMDTWLVLTVRPGTDPLGNLSSAIQAGRKGEEHIWTATSGSFPAKFLAQNADLSITSQLTLKSNDGQQTGSTDIQSDDSTSSVELEKELLQNPAKLLLELQALADAFRIKVLLYVDQLEELYTLEHAPDLRRAYMKAISRAADDSEGPIRVIFTLREDFLTRVVESNAARETLSHIMMLGAPGEKALLETITKPVELSGYTYEDVGLPQKMLDAVQDATSSLPLLQFACSQLWNRRDASQRLLTLAAYEEMGGVEGALASKADELLAGLSEAQRNMVRQLMLRLVTPEGTRRVMPTKQLLDGLDSSAALILDRLAATRMVVSRRAKGGEGAEAELELVHDSLIHSWKPLVRWLEQSREEVVFLDEVSRAAELWDSRGRPKEEVWSGTALDEALIKLERCTAVPNRVKEFLEAGKELRLVHARGRRRIIVAVIGALLAVITALSLVNREANIQRERALALMEEAREQRDREQQARASALREGARAAYTKGDFLEARSKLRASLEARDSAQARALWWLLENEPLVWSKTLDSFGNRVSVSPDGRLIAVSSRSITIYDTKTLERRVLLGHKSQVNGIDFSPDGRWLSSGSDDQEIRLWDLRNSTVKLLKGHSESVRSTAFSPDGKRLVSASEDTTIALWDIDSGTRIRVLKNETRVSRAFFSPDGRFIISINTDGKMHLWNAHSYELEKVIEEPELHIYDAVSSADGRLLAYGCSDGVLVLMNSDTWQKIARISDNTTSFGSLNFSPDADLLAASTSDGKVMVWDTKNYSLRGEFHYTKIAINSVSFLPDGEQLVSAGYDGTLKVWTINVHSLQKDSAGHRLPIYALAFAPNGKTIATGSTADGELLLWDVASSQSILRIHGHDTDIWDITYNHNGKLLAAGAYDGSIRLFSIPEGKLLKTLLGHNMVVSGVVFTPDDKQLVSSSYDKTIGFWDLESLTLHKSISAGDGINSIDIDPEGRLLASSLHAPIVEIRDIKTGLVLKRFSGHTNRVHSVVFSSDSKSLYSSSWDSTTRRYQLDDDSNDGDVVARHQSAIYWIDVTHLEEDILGTSSRDGTAKIWKVESGEVITLKSHQGEVNRLKFSPDGTYVATVSDDTTLRLWDTKTGRPFWRTPLMLEETRLLYTQQGWIGFETDAQPTPSTKQWQKAVDARAKLASASADQQTLCVVTFGDELELWNMNDDVRSSITELPKIQQILAIREGCLSLSEGSLMLTRTMGETVPWGTQVDAINRLSESVFVLQGGSVLILDLDGNRQDEFTATSGASSLTVVGHSVVLGFPDGRIEVWRRNGSRAERDLDCREVESTPVTTLIPGPPGTFIAGFANGSIGIWSVETGERLYSHHLHGPVIHLLHQNQTLWAATELGSRLRLDLSTFYIVYCELMERVWSMVPWIWQEERARFRARPTDHECSQ